MQRTLGNFGITKKARVGEGDSSKAVATEEKPRDETVVATAVAAEVPVEVDSVLFNLIRDQGWRQVLAPEIKKPYFPTLEKSVLEEYANRKVFPPKDMLFAALNMTPLESVRVVVLGQDPYHGAGQAMGNQSIVP